MKRFLHTALMILFVMFFTGCGGEGYTHITHKDAKKIMASNPKAIILDVRSHEEYERKHIPNALLVPIEEIRNGDFSKLPDKNATILIYCWTGRRAEDAAIILVENGYKNIYEFGGLVDWTGSITGTDLE